MQDVKGIQTYAWDDESPGAGYVRTPMLCQGSSLLANVVGNHHSASGRVLNDSAHTNFCYYHYDCLDRRRVGGMELRCGKHRAYQPCAL